MIRDIESIERASSTIFHTFLEISIMEFPWKFLEKTRAMEAFRVLSKELRLIKRRLRSKKRLVAQPRVVPYQCQTGRSRSSVRIQQAICCICDEKTTCYVCVSDHSICFQDLAQYCVLSFAGRDNLLCGEVTCPGITVGTKKCRHRIVISNLFDAFATESVPYEPIKAMYDSQKKYRIKVIEERAALSPKVMKNKSTEAEIQNCLNQIKDKVYLTSPHVELSCPHCTFPYSIHFEGPYKFTECASLQCGRCKNRFCGWCLGKSGETSEASHTHVRNCKENRYSGSISADKAGDFSVYISHHEEKRAIRAKECYDKMSLTARNLFLNHAYKEKIDRKYLKYILSKA